MGAKYRVAGILGKLLKEGEPGNRMNRPEASKALPSSEARGAAGEKSVKDRKVKAAGQRTAACRAGRPASRRIQTRLEDIK